MNLTSCAKDFASPNTSFTKPLMNSSKTTSEAFSKSQGSSSLTIKIQDLKLDFSSLYPDQKNTHTHSSNDSLSTYSSPVFSNIPPPKGVRINTSPMSSISSPTNSENSNPDITSTNEPSFFEETANHLSTSSRCHSVYFSQKKK